MTKLQKKFDCVEMKRNIQEKMYEETKNMNMTEFMDHVSTAVQKGHFAEKVRRIQARQQKERKAG